MIDIKIMNGNLLSTKKKIEKSPSDSKNVLNKNE